MDCPAPSSPHQKARAHFDHLMHLISKDDEAGLVAGLPGLDDKALGFAAHSSLFPAAVHAGAVNSLQILLNAFPDTHYPAKLQQEILTPATWEEALNDAPLPAIPLRCLPTLARAVSSNELLRVFEQACKTRVALEHLTPCVPPNLLGQWSVVVFPHYAQSLEKFSKFRPVEEPSNVLSSPLHIVRAYAQYELDQARAKCHILLRHADLDELLNALHTRRDIPDEIVHDLILDMHSAQDFATPLDLDAPWLQNHPQLLSRLQALGLEQGTGMSPALPSRRNL